MLFLKYLYQSILLPAVDIFSHCSKSSPTFRIAMLLSFIMIIYFFVLFWYCSIFKNLLFLYGFIYISLIIIVLKHFCTFCDYLDFLSCEVLIVFLLICRGYLYILEMSLPYIIYAANNYPILGLPFFTEWFILMEKCLNYNVIHFQNLFSFELLFFKSCLMNHLLLQSYRAFFSAIF